MHINELGNSTFLKKEDCAKPILVTISKVTRETVEKGGYGKPKKDGYVLHFVEDVKPMVLNKTNGRLIAQITGSETDDGWIGKKIVLYHEPNVEFGGQLVGGIRVRAPRNQPPQNTRAPVQQPRAVAPLPNPPMDDPPFDEQGGGMDGPDYSDGIPY